MASYFGGTRNALAISWPKRIKVRGEIRSQFHHVIDIMPTVHWFAAKQTPAPGIYVKNLRVEADAVVIAGFVENRISFPKISI